MVPKRRVVSEPFNFPDLSLDISKDWSLVNEPTLKKEDLDQIKRKPWMEDFDNFGLMELGPDEESKSSSSSKSI